MAGAVFFGGVAGPVLLMLGLAVTAASTASLLLNLEGVFTALLAWFAFKENFDRRIALGMAAITAGGAVLSWAGLPEPGVPWGALAVAAACLCWGIDNNLTRKVSAADPLQVAAIKGLVAGPVNVAVGLAVGGRLPGVWPLLGAGVVGFLGYGVSLTFFVLGLRHLGTARTGAYFSLAPFVWRGGLSVGVPRGSRRRLPRGGRPHGRGRLAAPDGEARTRTHAWRDGTRTPARPRRTPPP